MSVLYIVATPIGNVGDISQRALETLENVDVIYAEDTRTSGKLMQLCGIKNKIIALHKYNEVHKQQAVLEFLQQGKTAALISDAGTPTISDPGYLLVEYLRQNNIKVEVIPGCCSLIAALSISGLPSDKFEFAGFIPSKPSSRRNFLNEFITKQITTVFFETPHRIIDCLADFYSLLEENEREIRRIFIARELTKKFEDTILLTIKEAQNWILQNKDKSRGEFVLVLEASKNKSKENWQELTDLMIKHEVRTKTISKIIAEQTGEPQKKVYEYILLAK